MTSTPVSLRPEHPVARPLALLVDELGLAAGGDVAGVEVTGVTLSSADVQPGDLYVGLRGARSHGAGFASVAAEHGAVAVLTDAEGAELAAPSGLPIVRVDDPRAALGEVAAWVYRSREDPPVLFGITGTNGKTSTTYLLEAVLAQLGLVTGLSSTAERRIGDVAIPSRLTTPEATEMHALLARMHEAGVRAVAIEVSAQALSRARVDGIVFDVAGFTNLSHDHLDDYDDFEAYFGAKLSLFTPERARRGVVCLDTPWGARVVAESRIPVTTIATAERGGAAADAEWRVEILEESPTHTRFRVSGRDGPAIESRVPLLGRHMAANAGLALVMLHEAGFDLAAIDAALARDGGIRAYLPGRTELVSGASGPRVYVDFAHSPAAIESTLSAIRDITPGRTIVVFGANGDRDRSKRPEMGRIASELADVVVVTDQHPRSEDPAVIRRTLLDAVATASHPAEALEVVPPELAIRRAIALAGPDDAILWAGPGHLDYRDLGHERIPFSARDIARAALVETGWA